MLKRIYLIASILLLAMSANSQTPIEGKNFVLEDDLSGDTKVYIARDFIKLKPGFKYSIGQPEFFHAKIDENLLFDVEYQSEYTETNITDRELVKTLEVGATNASYAITQNGAATYNIPIMVPPGTAGMVPNLSVAYNSQAGNGNMGVGWNLVGLSAITRIAKTKEIDGTVGTININGDDRFSIDGNRLLVTSGTYGANNSVYHTEAESFSVITSHDIAGTGPKYFTVTTRDGSIIEYGNSSDSRVLTNISGKNDVFIWLINKVTDIYGNYLTYTYGKDATTNEYYIERIDYTGNTNEGLETFNSVRFLYERKQEINEVYVAGASFKSSYLLNKIRTYNEDDIVKQYEFKYFKTSEDLYTKLNEIIEYGSDGTRFNSTIIKWNEAVLGANKFQYEPAMNYHADATHDYIFGDYNGDGFTDYVEKITILEDFMYILHLNENGDFTSENEIMLDLSDDGMIGPEHSDIKTIADFNGDNKTDFLTFEYLPGGMYRVNVNYYSGGTMVKVPNVLETPTMFGIRTADFNGDGKTDILPINSPVAYLGGANFAFTPFIVSSSQVQTIMNATDLHIIDFNGNGKADIMAILTTSAPEFVSCVIYEYDEASASFSILYANNNVPNGTYFPINASSVYYPGDFNGDGKTDLLKFSRSSSSTPIILYSDGVGFISGSCPIIHPICPEDYDDNFIYFISDFNGDGTSDIFQMYKTPNQYEYSLNLYYSYGKNNEAAPITFKRENLIRQFPVCDKKHFKVTDINGDGQSEMMIYNTSYFFNKNDNRNLIHKIRNGLNQTVEFQYSKNTDNTVCLNNGLGDIKFDLAKAIITDDGVGGWNIANYIYNTPRYATWLHKFLGFSSVKTINQTTNIQVENKYDYYVNADNYSGKKIYKSFLRETIIGHVVDAEDYSKKTYVNNGYYFDDNRYLNYVSEVKTYDYKKGIQTVTTNTCEPTDLQNGNITSTKVKYGTISAVPENDYTFEEYTYSTLNPAKLIRQKTTKLIPSETESYSAEIEYTYYNNDMGKVATQTTYPGMDKAVTTTYTYDNYGNLTSNEVSASDIESRLTSFIYDDERHIFPIKTIKPVSDLVTFEDEKTYDYGSGLVTKTMDINGLITEYKYDGFGRLKETKFPTGLIIYNSIDFNEETDFSEALIVKSTYGDNIGTTTEYYDMLNRKIRTVVESFNSKKVTSNAYYLPTGQVDKISKPYYAEDGEIEVFKNYTYNNDGSKASVYDATSTIEYSYDGLSSTATNIVSTQYATKTYCPNGLLESVQSKSGTVNYEYFSSGLAKSITAHGKTVSMEYDDYQHQTILNDPDVAPAPMLYEYNSIGELIFQEDPKGNSFEMTYDKAGRLLEKTNPISTTEGNYSYVYDNGYLGKLSEISFDGAVQEFTYDDFGRIISLEESGIDNEVFTTEYTYNQTTGLNETIKYPSGFIVTNEYDDIGNLKRKKAQAGSQEQIIWELDEVNSKGQISKYNKNDGLFITDNIYDNTYGYLMSSVTNNTINSTSISEQSYDYYFEKGTLKSRSDNKHSLTETFTYDDINRLETSSEGTNVEYDANGNIILKDNLGSYYYDDTRPHAVTMIDNENEVSPDRQDITYNRFNSVERIEEGIKAMDFIYGVDNQRRKTIYTDGTITKTKYYGANYEKVIVSDGTTTTTKELHYIPSPSGLAAIYITDGTNGNLYYTYTDYLGSIQTIVDAQGSVVQESRYDAWGKRVAHSFTTTGELITDRGFTGHEHLDEFGLINMNGRLYDPLLGRMLSPDNFIQNPMNSQLFNRYSYAMNNPLSFTDPDGEIIGFIIAGAVIGAWIGGSIAEQNMWPGNWAWDNNTWNGIAKGAIIGALVGTGVGLMWEAGAAVTISVGAGNSSIPLISFSEAGFHTANTVAGLIGIGGSSAVAIGSINWSNINIARQQERNKEYIQFGGGSDNINYANVNLFFDNGFHLDPNLNQDVFSKYLGENIANNEAKPTSYYDVALTYENTPKLHGGVSSKGVDCSGLVCLATNSSYRWTVKSKQAPPGNWVKLDIDKGNYTSQLQEGDLLVFEWHTAFYAGIRNGSPSLFHMSATHGKVTFTPDAEWWILKGHFEAAYRQIFPEE